MACSMDIIKAEEDVLEAATGSRDLVRAAQALGSPMWTQDLERLALEPSRRSRTHSHKRRKGLFT